MTIRVAIGIPLFAEGDVTPRRMLEERGIELILNSHGRRLTEEETLDLLHVADGQEDGGRVAGLQEAGGPGVDGLLAGLEPLTRRVLTAAVPRLKAIARVGSGLSNVDLEAARELGIKISSTPAGPTQAVAEMTLAAMLALSRHLLTLNAGMHAGEWSQELCAGLAGARVLLVGYGRIGQRVGELARAFGAEVLVADPHVTADQLAPGDRLVGLEEGLGVAEIISLHASGVTPLLGPAEFDRMRPGVLLLNSARGELVDEDALVQALDEGQVAGAWFDAFWQEPYAGRLLEYPQVLLTPHAATHTIQCRQSMETAAVANLLRDLGLSTT